MVIQYFAMLREITRTREQVWNEPADTIGELLAAHCKRYGPSFRRWVLDEDGGLGQMAILLVNGHDVRDLDGLQTHLQANDTISIFPPVAGG